ncbi:MAG: hypothetical protein OXI05_00195, partial [Bacteroidota bacterium]|nr:hypothetical protein [Bacteroidota bacterium]
MGRGGINPDLAVFQELIKGEALVTVEKDPYDKNFLELNELGEGGSPGYKIIIRDTPEDTIAIKSDMFPSPEMIFRGDRGECKRADFVIVARDGEKNWIIYIEMKKGQPRSVREVRQQLQGSKCFIDYCRAVGQVFWGERGFLKDYQQRYVCVKNIGLDKRPTREPGNLPLHDSP